MDLAPDLSTVNRRPATLFAVGIFTNLFASLRHIMDCNFFGCEIQFSPEDQGSYVCRVLRNLMKSTKYAFIGDRRDSETNNVTLVH